MASHGVPKLFISMIKPFRQFQLQVVLFIFLAATSMMQSASFFSQLQNNYGWIQLVLESSEEGYSGSTSVNYFTRALEYDQSNNRAHLGAGMAYARVLDESNAYQHWQQGALGPDLLNQLGDQIRARGLRDIAFIYFRSADELVQTPPGEGYFQAGRLCQSSFANLTLLSPRNQQYCEEYFANNMRNLLLDGQFEQNISWGWNGAFFFNDQSRATIAVDKAKGVSAPSLELSGLIPGRHAGVYQRITLQPGSTVRFSGYFRVEEHNDLEAWLLYVEWRQNEQIQGTYFHVADSSTDWTYLESLFNLPNGSDSWVQFYPAFLIGRGTVWIDNVVVEFMPETE